MTIRKVSSRKSFVDERLPEHYVPFTYSYRNDIVVTYALHEEVRRLKLTVLAWGSWTSTLRMASSCGGFNTVIG